MNILNSFINFIQEILFLHLQEVLQYAMLIDIVFKVIFSSVGYRFKEIKVFSQISFPSR